MGLVCNDRQAACIALDGIQTLALPNQARLERMRGKIPELDSEQAKSEQWKIYTQIALGQTWQTAKDQVQQLI